MTKIDISKWKPFAIEKLFTVVKGTRLTKANMRDGDVRFIGASAINNGVTSHIANKEKLHPANTITITYNGSVGEAFYQDKEFWASDDVNVLYSKFEMNRYTALFIIPLLKSAGRKYAFIDKWKKETMEKDSIMLPVDQTGNPDFIYMESYMRNLESTVSSSLIALRSAKNSKKFDSVHTNEWSDFKIIDLFDVKNTHSILKSDIKEESGETPYITASNENNGVYSYVKFDEQLIEEGNCIMIGGKTLTITYQEKDFFSNDSHNLALYLKNGAYRKKNIQLFLITALKASIGNIYTWGDSISHKSIQKDTVKLPIDSKGYPDFNYMELYMTQIEERTNRRINDLMLA